jgi:hypothetical protein
MSRQSDLAVNVFIVVTERALVVIHNLSDSHLRSEKVSMCYDGQTEIELNVPWCKVQNPSGVERFCACVRLTLISEIIRNHGRMREQERMAIRCGYVSD